MTEVRDVPLPMPPAVDPGGGATVVVSVLEDEGYDRLLTDLWVGIVLTLMVLSCIGCLFSCFLYHAFKQWQTRVLEAQRREAHMEGGYDTESLPSYTVVAGLPSYEEAIEQLKQGTTQLDETLPSDPDGSSPPVFSRLSVGDLLEIYKAGAKK